MAFSDLCHIGNAYKTVENDTDQSERIMEENSIVRDLITKILDETGPTEGGGSSQSSEKSISSIQSVYPKTDTGNTSFIPPSYNYNNSYNFTQNDHNGFNNYNMPNGFGTNGFVNYPDNDVTALLGIDLVTDATDSVTPEQLNLLRLAAQEIGGAQFTNPNKFDDKFYNYFEPNQRHSLPETNMFNVNFSRPNSLNLDMNFNANFDFANQRFPNYKDQNQDPAEILAYLSQLNISLERTRDETMLNGMDFKMPLDLNGHYPNDYNKMDEQGKFYNRNFPNKTFDNFYDMMHDRSPNQNYEFPSPPIPSNAMNYKNNGYQNEFLHRRDMNQLMPRDGYQANGLSDRSNFENMGRDMQQVALMRQNHEIARQMSLIMRNRPPPNQLNVDVFLHENTFGLGLGALLGPNQQMQPQVVTSPVVDIPLLAPFYALRTAKNPLTPSSILHARLDACYEQWRQLERERKRTEARLALAYPGRAVSSSNSIPVPRLPPCPTRVDRLTVDMLREHTKVLTLMGKMETLRASVCVANKKPSKPEENKIIVLKRGQDNTVATEKEMGLDPATFEPSSWRDQVRHTLDMGTCVAPHPEVESAMVTWRSAVCAVQAARRKELAALRDPRTPTASRSAKNDLQLADAVRHLCVCARRARAAMWADLTLTVALSAAHAPTPPALPTSDQPALTAQPHHSETPQLSVAGLPAIMPPPDTSNTTANTTAQNNAQPTTSDAKEEKSTSETKPEQKSEITNKPANKQTDKDKNRRTQYRKVNQGRNDFYQKNQRYDNRFMHRHPYHYLATGPIN